MGKLSDTRLRGLKPSATIQKFTDGDGLYLKITPVGGMYWQWRIRTPTGETTVTYGVYPKVGLAEARKRHREAQEQRKAGVINPNLLKHCAKQTVELEAKNTFEAVAREWFEVRRHDWVDTYSGRLLRRLELDVFPWMGLRPVDQIKPPELLTVIRRIESRGVFETAHRALESCSQVFRYAIATGRTESNPGRDLKDALRTPPVRHFPAITDQEELGQLLRAIDGYAGTYVVKAALRLAPMLFLRPGELRHACWSEFDLDRGEWAIPAMRMKGRKQEKLNGKPHFVPLPQQAVIILQDLEKLTGQAKGYVFRGERDHGRPMSDSTVNAALRALGFSADKVTGHGFRATARTLLAEELGYRTEVIEAQLAHAVADANGRAYNRTEFLAERREMMQRWADYLSALKAASVKAQILKPANHSLKPVNDGRTPAGSHEPQSPAQNRATSPVNDNLLAAQP
jgi:integrase